MLKIIRNLLAKIIDDIDAGNSNITEDEAIKLIGTLKELTDKEKRLSKYAACRYLNISRATGVFYHNTITHADVYVAINSHYHDYCELFKAWFGDGIDQKIIESAIIFWFKDDDHREGSKLWNYFKEN